MFYDILVQNKRIEKISVPSFDNLWDSKMLSDTIKLCTENIKEPIDLIGDLSWQQLVADVGKESERRININIFFDKAINVVKCF